MTSLLSCSVWNFVAIDFIFKVNERKTIEFKLWWKNVSKMDIKVPWNTFEVDYLFSVTVIRRGLVKRKWKFWRHIWLQYIPSNVDMIFIWFVLFRWYHNYRVIHLSYYPYSSWLSHTGTRRQWTLSLYSLSGRTTYRQISWSLEAARLDVIMIVSLWNLTDISAALLLKCLSNIRAIEKSLNPNLAASRRREILR